MTERQDNSTLPILLTISGAVVLAVGAGWFLLDDDAVAPSAESVTISELPPDAVASAPAVEQPGESPSQEPEPASNVTEEPPADEKAVTTDIDADLRKARLAADADILAFPTEQSAFFFYNRILTADPGHAVARAELDAVLARISQIMSDHLAAEEYDDAYRLAMLVAQRRPDLPAVQEVMQVLDDRIGELVSQAMEHAQNGDDEQAAAMLALAETVPGRNRDYFRAVRDSIAEIQQSLREAEADRVQRARDAAAAVRQAWIDRVRGAIASGHLIAPAGQSARDFLNERDGSDELQAELTAELVEAMIVAASDSIDSGNLAMAETMLDAADEMGGAAGVDSVAVRERMENAYVEAESSRVASLSEFVVISTEAPRFPTSAKRRDITGWVDVEFTVTQAGSTADITVTQSEPARVFDTSAVRAVEQWTFEPRMYRGQAIEQRAAARLVFRLE